MTSASFKLTDDTPGFMTVLKFGTYLQYAEKAQSSNLQRPWSVHSEGKSEATKQWEAYYPQTSYEQSTSSVVC